MSKRIEFKILSLVIYLYMYQKTCTAFFK